MGDLSSVKFGFAELDLYGYDLSKFVGFSDIINDKYLSGCHWVLFVDLVNGLFVDYSSIDQDDFLKLLISIGKLIDIFSIHSLDDWT